ncbi:TniQ [Kutzneria sp. CA-103260]|nr:TniQ [Kutzneria sp. CA-103260]
MTSIPQPRRSCRYCGVPLASDADYSKAVCSRSCDLRAYRVRQHELKALRKDPDTRRRYRVCDQEIVNVGELRSDASYCSGACRTTAYRDRKTGHAPPPLMARPDVRPLPIPVKPVNHETLFSYIRRLTNANDIPDRDLLRHLQNSRGHHRKVDVDRLAAATGRPTRALRLALPELRNVYEQRLAARSGHEVDLLTLQIRPACRRCTASHDREWRRRPRTATRHLAHAGDRWRAAPASQSSSSPQTSAGHRGSRRSLGNMPAPTGMPRPSAAHPTTDTHLHNGQIAR